MHFYFIFWRGRWKFSVATHTIIYLPLPLSTLWTCVCVAKRNCERRNESEILCVFLRLLRLLLCLWSIYCKANTCLTLKYCHNMQIKGNLYVCMHSSLRDFSLLTKKRAIVMPLWPVFWLILVDLLHPGPIIWVCNYVWHFVQLYLAASFASSSSSSASILAKRNQCNYKAVPCVSFCLPRSLSPLSCFPSTPSAATVSTFLFSADCNQSRWFSGLEERKLLKEAYNQERKRDREKEKVIHTMPTIKYSYIW